MATSQDIDAITEYIEGHRAKIPKFPDVKEVITEYEQWLTNLTWYGRYVDTDSSLAEAKWYRDRLNAMTGNQLPEDWIPADAAKAAETTATAPGLMSKLKPSTKYYLVAGGIAVTALIIYTGPMYLTAILRARTPRPSFKDRFDKLSGGLNLSSIRTRLSR